jgi:hypothetical protein
MIASPVRLASQSAKAKPVLPRLDVVLLAVPIEVLEADHGLESAHLFTASLARSSPRR